MIAGRFMQGFIDEDILRDVLKYCLATGADFAEIFLEERTATSVGIEDGKVKSYSLIADRGAGIRVMKNSVTGYAYSDLMEKASLMDAAGVARTIAEGPGPFTEQLRFVSKTAPPLYYRMPVSEVSESDRVRLLLEGDAAAREFSPHIKQVYASYADGSSRKEVVNSRGARASETHEGVYFGIFVTAEKDGLVQQAGRQVGGNAGFEKFAGTPPAELARKAAESAVRMLGAINAPAGKMPVILANGEGTTGTLIHEACGHAMEADYVSKGQSVYSGKLGRKVAHSSVSVVDDGTASAHAGTGHFDDEGTDTHRTMLVTDGVLTSYLCDLDYAGKLDIPPTGNGRRQSYRHPPLPRMTNTFIAAGNDDPEDLIADVKRGLYVAEMGGGIGDVTGSGFTFGVQEGYLIENGKITSPVKGAVLTGKGWDVLNDVKGVGNDLGFEPGGGACGKMQMVPVTTGGPTVYLASMAVGGTNI